MAWVELRSDRQLYWFVLCLRNLGRPPPLDEADSLHLSVDLSPSYLDLPILCGSFVDWRLLEETVDPSLGQSQGSNHHLTV